MTRNDQRKPDRVRSIRGKATIVVLIAIVAVGAILAIWLYPADKDAGVASTEPASVAVPKRTAKGTPSGAEAKAAIGTAGGTIQSSDGHATLVIPAGALAATAELAVSPLENLSPGGLGNAYRLTPDGQAFTHPVSLTVSYDPAALAGVPLAALAFATQREDGAWELQSAGAADEVAMTVTGSLRHFSDWSLVKEFQIRPESALVKVRQSVPLAMLYCFKPLTDGEPFPLGYECDFASVALAPLLPATPAFNWSVNGVKGGSTELGTLASNGNRAIYTAPNNRPPKATVAVSAELATVGGGKTLVVSNITIIGDLQTYFGTFTAKSPPTQTDVVYSVAGTMTLEQVDEGSSNYVATAGSMMIDYDVQGCAHYQRAHPMAGAELSLDTPDDGQHWLTLGVEAIELSCNGIELGAAISLHPCMPGDGGSKPVSIAGEATCYDGTFTWQLSRQ